MEKPDLCLLYSVVRAVNAYGDGGDVSGPVVGVVVGAVDGVVSQPLDVVLQVADDAALEVDCLALVHRLVARAATNDRRMR